MNYNLEVNIAGEYRFERSFSSLVDAINWGQEQLSQNFWRVSVGSTVEYAYDPSSAIMADAASELNRFAVQERWRTTFANLRLAEQTRQQMENIATVQRRSNHDRQRSRRRPFYYPRNNPTIVSNKVNWQKEGF